MIPNNFEYSAPQTLQDALSLLSNENAKPLAGGMSLIPMMKLRLASPSQLVDLGRIAGLNFIREEGGSIHIGPTTTHHEIETSPVLHAKCPLLAEAASHIGDLQVRNMGTIGGSSAHADPAADYPAALQCLEATIQIASAKGQRGVTAAEFFVDTLTTALEPGEVISEIIVPIEQPGTGVNYQKVVNPASGYAVVGIAVRVRKSDGKVDFVCVGITGLANKSYRAMQTEEALLGSAGALDDIQRAAALATSGIQANSDLFASPEYRMQLARVYTARALAAALARAA